MKIRGKGQSSSACQNQTYRRGQNTEQIRQGPVRTCHPHLWCFLGKPDPTRSTHRGVHGSHGLGVHPRITQTLTVHSPNNKALGVSVCRAALLRVRAGGLPPVSICFVQFILEQIFISVKHNKIKHVYRLLPHRQIFCGNMAAILVHTRCASYTQLNSSQFPIKIIW